jgi:hypothetical protein
MRPSRSFRPSAPMELEGRLVPSAIAAAITQLIAHERKLGVNVQHVSLSPAQIAQSNASDLQFGLSASDSIHAGQTVEEQLTTTYAIGSPQTETLIKVPDLSNNSVTTYKTINLRNNGGIETVVDTETFSGGTIPFSGTQNTHTIKTTLPNGTIQNEIENETIVGHKTVINATIHEADGDVETWNSVSIKHGPTTTDNRTITEPDGTTEHQKSVTTHVGDLDSTTKTTTTRPGEIVVSTSATNVTRVQPPAS